MAAITLAGVTRRVDDRVILRDVSLHIKDGELMVIVGPSGSGKSSIIRAIAGLDSLAAGAVMFGDADFTAVEVAKRDVGIVFQASTLFPTKTAGDNVGFPLKVRAMSREAIHKRVGAEARALGIEHILERWPRQLSAGHQQLVQIARAMVRVPKVLLLDEPMANLDLPTRRRLRRDLRELQRGYGVTTVYATNDPEEAMFMADRIAAIEDGRLKQVGTPDELYSAPADSHIAWLTGSISFVEARVARDTDGYWLVGDGLKMRAWAPDLAPYVNNEVRLGIRPDGVRMVPDSTVRGRVLRPSFESGTPVTRVAVAGGVIAIRAVDVPEETEIGLSVDRYLVFGVDEQLVAVVG